MLLCRRSRSVRHQESGMGDRRCKYANTCYPVCMVSPGTQICDRVLPAPILTKNTCCTFSVDWTVLWSLPSKNKGMPREQNKPKTDSSLHEFVYYEMLKTVLLVHILLRNQCVWCNQPGGVIHFNKPAWVRYLPGCESAVKYRRF